MAKELLNYDKTNNYLKKRYMYDNCIVQPIIENCFTCYNCDFINTCRKGGSTNGAFIIPRASVRACGGFAYPLKIIE